SGVFTGAARHRGHGSAGGWKPLPQSHEVERRVCDVSRHIYAPHCSLSPAEGVAEIVSARRKPASSHFNHRANRSSSGEWIDTTSRQNVALAQALAKKRRLCSTMPSP